MSRFLAGDAHAMLSNSWPKALEELGVAPEFLRNTHGPCPACGGKDRYRFDNKNRRGDFYCNGCGAGDGFMLLQRVHGWDFRQALNAVAGYLGFEARAVDRKASPPPAPRPVEKAVATQRVKDILSTVTRPDLVADVVTYLASRNVWPLPEPCELYAHVSVEYRRRSVAKSWVSEGTFPCLVAPVKDVHGETVTVHLTYLENGQKLARFDPDGSALAARKILSPLTGRVGCAVRLGPLNGDVVGISEGIETALSAYRATGICTWAALNTSLLAKFVPPPGVRHVVIFADRDTAGMEAAWELRDQLDGRCSVELQLPPSKFADWNDYGRAA